MINGKKIKANQNKEKRVAGNNQVPTILRIKIALNKINKLINIDNNFDKIASANFVCFFEISKVDSAMKLFRQTVFL
ncbi:hypothetical protein [Flavobacterium eburneipallidum]|uniref:hypothetical protein n=1 Tax=Flavobacterium eburneipallidum TaxID=3003263 RepID=UPI00248265FF|nr:hypothetical protein [Flavobacterium eburneipallidum]